MREDAVDVSTHSRLKAAGCPFKKILCQLTGFNTQPPEGGWANGAAMRARRSCFNTQPPEGGWVLATAKQAWAEYVSTHSRLKAAGSDCPSR